MSATKNRQPSTKAKPQQRASQKGQTSQRRTSNTGQSSQGRSIPAHDRGMGMKDSMFMGSHQDGAFPQMMRGDGNHNHSHMVRSRGGRMSSHGRYINELDYRSNRDVNSADRTIEEESPLLVSLDTPGADPPPSYSASRGASARQDSTSSKDSHASKKVSFTSRDSHVSRSSHKASESKPTFVNMNWCDAEVLTYSAKQRIMYIMRGLPGSGKSTIARNIVESYKKRTVVVCSADDFR